MTDERKMQAGDDPADFTVDQVQAHLATADDTEQERVLQAERDGRARVSLVGGDEGTYDEQVGREDTTSAFIIPNHNTIPQSVQDEDAARRNEELQEAGVNQAQGFIGSDGSANLLG